MDTDFETIYAIISEVARAYKGVIPVDRWREPYMPRDELHHEINYGVCFRAYEEAGRILGVMGIQDVKDVSLIRHAYVGEASQNKGIGKKLLSYLPEQTSRPVLVGTWASADWAIHFYERQSFRQVDDETKNILLKKHWSIPERQVETSVVLTDKKWVIPSGSSKEQSDWSLSGLGITSEV